MDACGAITVVVSIDSLNVCQSDYLNAFGDAFQVPYYRSRLAAKLKLLNEVNIVTNKDKTPAEGDSGNLDSGFELVDLEFSLSRLGGDSELLSEIVQIFFEDSPELLQELVIAVNASDAANTMRTAHILKGLVSNFGENEAVDLVRNIELAAREGDMDSARQHLDGFLSNYKALNRELAELVN
ncbi:MAG: HPt (histidine-containing phosphotransfer) domain-containing protein [Mariniblastus sp.]